LEQLGRRHVNSAADAVYEAAKRLRAIAASLRGLPIDVNAVAQKAYAHTQRLPYAWAP
jgi:hypothetical protein